MKIDLEGTVGDMVRGIMHQVESRAFRAANELRNSELNVLRGRRSGRVYRRPFTKQGTYRASAPGEPPAVRSGDLRRKWKPQTSCEHTGSGLIVTPAIATKVRYARFLEEGTSKMAPRPFRDAIIERAMPRVTRIFKEPFR